MLKTSLNYLKQRIALVKNIVVAQPTVMSAPVSEIVVEKRSEDNLSIELNDAKKLKTTDTTSIANESRTNKRKYALLIGYCGEGYFGLQRNAKLKENHQFRTIEDEIVDGLVKINAVPQAHSEDMYKMSFQRAARTDKGVSAAANLISLKMEMQDDTLERLNETLPPQIRVFGSNKVTQSFCCKQNCDARTYIYILPTFAFCPVEEILSESFRASDDVIKRVNKTLSQFVGTHNFHNCTSGKKYTDPSAKRYIYSFECSKPFMKNGYEFAVIKIKGQSFMLHQIRKMVGLIIAIVQGYAAEDAIELSRSAFKIEVPQAPALGLMLEQLHYTKYDRKFGNDGVHRPIRMPELDDEMDKFKHEFIFKNIIEKEIENKGMLKWLATLPLCHFGPQDPQFQRFEYTGLSRASYLAAVASGTYTERGQKKEEEGGEE